MRVTWTDSASRDLRFAYAWIAQDRPAAALKQVRRIWEFAAKLSDFPNLGRPGRRPGTRELVVPGGPFIVAYRVSDDLVEILRVLHASRRWPTSP
ncbi:type II toxin-antitoxin system RelE/ParE family toxin [Caulobacter vibrioides]|uniref:type II toxin-antitoxin system RelE/ParE family toxin n=1 Tax=Caulobacter vibrioides TaxID=155892 RepID=UPI000BB4994A|nr:type II toxin-antitoxin system RelE/ParE family toxin [Caulobacter vibrioides]ATC24003.1 type II toxin-antitoxin system RelE/ParE family toxin [Caulobacter vibrioides]AZH12250.1 type II toxin-antitoxin system RelE/ParE family toxin [Caulobacter vibrioides]PLR10551.1 type II toxin-antitoxin system RelE/ParE family toxin [Caulobacter vibrioides]